jgi:DNA helicase HerA-like ATPase
MASSIVGTIAGIASGDLFKRSKSSGNWATGQFVGRPYHLDYDRALLLVADAWKHNAGGLPQGSFLLGYYENEEQVAEALLLRVLGQASLPTDSDVISSMVEYYKDNLRTSGSETQLDEFTRYEFGFSGLECRALGTFYRCQDGNVRFGADVENFYSAHNYSVIKPNPEILELIVNFREGETSGGPADIRIGRVRYSSSGRFQDLEPEVPVYINPNDFMGKRTALFGMTRTGKSNTVKKIIEATASMSVKAPERLAKASATSANEYVDPFTQAGQPRFPVGQIIFDINGEYANANLQDEGTAIFEMYRHLVTRYSVLDKPDFKVMKVNFYRDIQSGFELVKSNLGLDPSDYVRSLVAIDLVPPEDTEDVSAKVRHDRKVAAYLCCLHAAGFPAPKGFRVRYSGNADLNAMIRDNFPDPKNGVSLEDATNWFSTVWDNQGADYFAKYRREKGHDWADEDLKAILAFLTRKTKPGGNANISGYRKLRDMIPLHTDSVGKPFQEEIIQELRAGGIVIVDLSQGDPTIQAMYSERICRGIFADAMNRFVHNQPNNFVQFYFEEAHNLFPKKEDSDLSQIYNRLAKEGAKLNLGLTYATQEVSSISSAILKNTQNWFIAHLNNEDETREIKKYYDFGDFAASLVRFSAATDRGFVRMKTYSNPFVVPVKIDRFTARQDEG